MAIMREMCPELNQSEIDYYKANEITEYIDLDDSLYDDLCMVQIYYKLNDQEIAMHEFDSWACKAY